MEGLWLVDNRHMRIRFTKMQGAGNDFVVLDETRERLNLSPAHYRYLADRHFGVGADQILTVRPAPQADVDFEYVIHNADGGEVEHCGNGSRCFVRFVQEQGLTDKASIRVKVHGGVIELHALANGQVKVDMGAPILGLPRIPFDPRHALEVTSDSVLSNLPIDQQSAVLPSKANQYWLLQLENGNTATVGVVSMGNPHAVIFVDEITDALVHQAGPVLERHAAFPRRANIEFVKVLSRGAFQMRVWERGSGETLACGTGACAVAVAGAITNRLDRSCEGRLLGGNLKLEWSSQTNHVLMTGPATEVFVGEWPG